MAGPHGGTPADSASGAQSASHSSKVSDWGMNGPTSQVNTFEKVPSVAHETEEQL